MRAEFVCPVGKRRSPIGQACVGALSFTTEHELAAQLCMDTSGAENGKVLITPLCWSFTTMFDRYKVVGERAAENAALTLSAVAGRAAGGQARMGAINGGGSSRAAARAGSGSAQRQETDDVLDMLADMASEEPARLLGASWSWWN